MTLTVSVLEGAAPAAAGFDIYQGFELIKDNYNRITSSIL